MSFIVIHEIQNALVLQITGSINNPEIRNLTLSEMFVHFLSLMLSISNIFKIETPLILYFHLSYRR